MISLTSRVLAALLLLHRPAAALQLPAVGALLCDVRTPALVIDCTVLRSVASSELDAALAAAEPHDMDELLGDAVYIHTGVVRGRDPAGAGSADPSVLATLDCDLDECGGPAAYLGLGLNNHFTGGYYWGRSSGPGAAMPAPGIALSRADGVVQLRRVSNSNDGKRSEWCEFLRRGDQVQLVPPTPSAALGASASAPYVVGVRRDGGVPPGAEPVVEAVWTRSEGGSGGWSLAEREVL